MQKARELRNGAAQDDGEPVCDAGRTVSPARSGHEVLPAGLAEDRMYYWDRMSHLIRLQRWWKSIFARRIIHSKAVQRRHELAELFESESAQTIQAAWRRFHRERM